MVRTLLLLSTFLGLSPTVSVAVQDRESAKSTVESLTIATDRAEAIYMRGDPVTFTAELKRGGSLAGVGEIAWTLSKDGVEPRRSGRIALDAGRARITGSLDEPGFLQCRVEIERDEQTLIALAAAAVSPLEIAPSLPVPDDFDEFWLAQKARLAAIPMNARLAPVESTRHGVEAFDVQVDCVGPAVSGYFARPFGAEPRKHPAILLVHGAGVRSSVLSTPVAWAGEGLLALDINAHGLPNGRDQEFYDGLRHGALKGYPRRGHESRETNYFLGVFLRLVRAIDFLTAQPAWDGHTLVVSGSSQGGGQAIAAAGLDSRVSFFVAGLPALCDHTGVIAGRVNGWPKFIATGEKPADGIVDAVRYFDAVNFAHRAQAPGFFSVGFIDTTCPPTGVYAAFNALAKPKEIFNDIAAGHGPSASDRGARTRAAILDHLAAQRATVAP